MQQCVLPELVHNSVTDPEFLFFILEKPLKQHFQHQGTPSLFGAPYGKVTRRNLRLSERGDPRRRGSER